MWKIFFMIFGLLLSSPCHGYEYYVASDGDVNNPGSITQPFTIQKIMWMARPGDIFYLRGGIYYDYITFRWSGTADNPITIQAYPGEHVVFDGSSVAYNSDDPWSSPSMITIQCNYLVLKGFEIINSALAGIEILGNYNTLDGIIAHDNSMTGIHMSASYNTVVNSVSYNNTRMMGDSDGFGIYQGYGNTYRYCESYGNSDDGFDTWRSSGNHYEYCRSHNNGWGPYGNGDGQGFKLGGLNELGQGDGGYNTVRYCVSYNNRVNGFDANNGSGNIVVNCTGYGNPGWGGHDGDFFNTSGKINYFINNVSYLNRVNIRYPGVSEHDSWNLAISNQNFASLEPTSPSFLHLSETSPCIDAGLSFYVNQGDTLVSLTPDDYSGSAPDLGAFEFGLSTGIGDSDNDLPSQTARIQTYPNPCNAQATIEYSVPRDAYTTVSIYSITGQKVDVLTESFVRAGKYSIVWDTSAMPSGLYFCLVDAGGVTAAQKMVVLK